MRRLAYTDPDALSVDVEEHFQVEAFAGTVAPESWMQMPSRVVANTHRVLDLFARYHARATFFVVGWVAERYPQLVRDILSSGHEVGCHSYAHRALWRLTPEQFREDTRRGLQAIAEACGVRPIGYRAPTFSVTERTLWALEILAEEGIEYDSSVFPIAHDWYGMPDAPRFTFRWEVGGGRSLYEMPMSTVTLAGRNLPTGGGGYLRILPMTYVRWSMRRLRQHESRPAMVYLHPWEIDPEQPRIAAPLKSRLRHYTRLGGFERRLRWLLTSRRFAPMSEVLRAEVNRNHIPLRFVAVKAKALALGAYPAV